MKIPQIAYNKFYDVLIDYYLENEFFENECDKLKQRSPQIWEEKSKRSGKIPVSQLFGKYSSDNRIFYRIKCYAKDGFCEINDDLFIEALVYIGIELPYNIAGKVIELTNRASLFFQTFLEQHYSEFIKKYNYCVVYDRVEGDIYVENSSLDSLLGSNDELENYDSKTVIRENEIIMKIVKNYYHYIVEDELQNAWNLLSSFCQRFTWKNNFEKFSSYNRNMINTNIHVWDISVKREGATCKVYSEAKINSLTSIELGNINRLTVGHLDEFCKRIKSIQDKATLLSLDIKNVKLKEFFETDFSEHLYYECGFNRNELKKLLDDDELVTVKRCFTMSFGVDGTSWKIHSISPFNTRGYDNRYSPLT